MALTTRTPSTFDDLHRAVDSMFRDFGSDVSVFPTGSMLPATPWTTLGSRGGMRLDVLEKDNEYDVHVDLPGVPKENIRLNVDENIMSIEAERTQSREEGREGQFHISERRYGKMSRSIPVPNDVDVGKVQAKYENGELCITLPKSKEASLKKSINIQ